MAFTQTWDDAFEALPADDGLISIGADQIRDLKEGMRERIQIDHEIFTADSGVDTGYHKRVTLKKVAGGPSEAASGYAELGYNSTDGTLEVYPEGGSKLTVIDSTSIPRLALGFARISSAGALVSGYNIASVTRTAAGKYTVSLTSGASGANNLIAVASVDAFPSISYNMLTIYAEIKSSTSVGVYIGQSGYGDSGHDQDFSLIVFKVA